MIPLIPPFAALRWVHSWTHTAAALLEDALTLAEGLADRWMRK